LVFCTEPKRGPASRREASEEKGRLAQEARSAVAQRAGR